MVHHNRCCGTPAFAIRFKYILCYGSSCVWYHEQPILSNLNTSYVMVHQRTKLTVTWSIWHLNTSYVMVHPHRTASKRSGPENLNTSYVMVHLLWRSSTSFCDWYLNTSYVMVHPWTQGYFCTNKGHLNTSYVMVHRRHRRRGPCRNDI